MMISFSCHDPDCRMVSFRGKYNALPKTLQNEIRDVLLEKEIQVDESFINALLSLSLTPAKHKDIGDKPKDVEDDVAKYYCETSDEDFISSLMTLSLSPKTSKGESETDDISNKQKI